MGDDTDAMDRMLAAQAAAAANASTQRRSDGDIKELEIDHVCDRIYENMEEEAMLEILRDLQHELVPFAASALASKPSVTKVATSAPKAIKAAEPSTACADKAKEKSNDYLWNVVA